MQPYCQTEQLLALWQSVYLVCIVNNKNDAGEGNYELQVSKGDELKKIGRH
jgi:hypothetical protein